MTYYKKKFWITQAFYVNCIFKCFDFDQVILTTTPSNSNGHMEHHLIHKEPKSW
jgi:hypothetical protein